MSNERGPFEGAPNRDPDAEARLCHLLLTALRAPMLDAIRREHDRIARFHRGPAAQCVSGELAPVYDAIVALHDAGRDVEALAVRAWLVARDLDTDAIDRALARVEAATCGHPRARDSELSAYLGDLARQRVIAVLTDGATADLRDGNAGAARVLLEQASELAAMSAPAEPTPDPIARVFGPVSDALNKHPPDRKWLLERTIPMGRVAILAGPGGVGKSWALTQLAISSVTGRSWLGYRTAAPTGQRVLLALAEEDHEEVQRRVYYGCEDLDDDDRALVARHLYVLPLAGTLVHLTDSDGEPTVRVAQLRACLDSEGPPWSAIILDPLSRWAGAETELDNAKATRFLQVVETLATVRGNPAIVVAHHERKSGKEEEGSGAIRGASGIVDGARTAARLASVDAGELHGARLRWVKHNYSGQPAEVILVREEHGRLRPAEPSERQAFEDAAAKASERTTNGSGRTRKGSASEPEVRKPNLDVSDVKFG